MLTSRRVVLILISFLLVLLGVRLVWIFYLTPQNIAQTVQGVADLRDRELDSEGLISLRGEWEFYQNQLIMDNNGALPSPTERTMLQVPGKWNGPPFGYGSYRLRVLVNGDAEQIYGIKVPMIPSSSELFVNGKMLGRSGETGESADDYTARNVPYTAIFASDREEIEIVVQVANFDDRLGGGIFGPIVFGDGISISQNAQMSSWLQISLCLILLVHAAYSVILYFMGVRQRGLLYFFGLVVCAMISTLIDDSQLLLVWFPIDNDWSYRIFYIVYLGIAGFLMQFMSYLMPGSGRKRGLRAYTTVCVAYSLAALFLPVNWLTRMDALHTIIIMIPYLVISVLAFRSVTKGNKDTIFILMGVSAVTFNIIWGLIRASFWQEMGFYPMDMIAAFVAFASYWFKRYLRTSEQTVKHAMKMMEEDRLKDQFLARTSHELRNPLHAMLNIGHSLLRGNGNYDETANRENMELLVSVGKRMSLLLNDLLDLARLKENRINLQLRAVNVQGVVSGVLDMVRFMTEGKPIQLINRVPDDFPPVVADENRLVQILFNLLHNAAKFTNEGYIAVDASFRNGQAYVAVSDTGIGMNEDTKQVLFEPYEQGRGPIQAGDVSGLGLGLSICKQLVELHRGTISVTSSPNEGSEFTFTLPISDEDVPQDEVTREEVPAKALVMPDVMKETAAALLASGPELYKRDPADIANILVVDDDPVNLRVLEEVLAMESYEITKAKNGNEAIAILATKEWDLVIADVMMPRMSGFELSRAIRERYKIAELPILLLTARGQPEDIEAGFQAGANDYLVKPVDAMELKSRVRALTDGKKSFRERLRMEAAWLQAQIQPHFLFNTLTSIAALSELDTVRMRTLVEVFGNYLRASFDPRNLERIVPLRHELDLVRSYLYIEKERFENRLQVEWDVDESIHLTVPPLSIQPLVENAVRHGIMKRVGGGKIRIRIVEYEDCAEVRIEDDGVGMDESTRRRLLDDHGGQDRGIGLRNTNRRLKQLYGQGLRIISSPGSGTTIIFMVKKAKF
ncbi:hybrid sensor histidine kinase/response regulator [Cohnella herbarum]|uniref:histidine kinase n=1 Tax=Cohnella herbarum TaxID=2728023 RepID=A0A7Z2ZN66_9BACL|nr:ATP-binding protein [Cohnella herbarum]QJD85774.1 response regulator [Cohnella herbarum]